MARRGLAGRGEAGMTNSSLTIREVVRRLGGEHEIARTVGLRPTSIRNWIADGYVPPKHHATVIELAAGKGVTVTAEELDPK